MMEVSSLKMQFRAKLRAKLQPPEIHTNQLDRAITRKTKP